MFRTFVTIVFALVATTGFAQSFDRTELDLLLALKRQPTVLARYEYLVRHTPKLTDNDKLFAEQFEAFAQVELGLYNQAVLSFPLDSDPPTGLVLPEPAYYKAADALDVISRLAVDRRIVMINEAHHNAHTRQLTLALLPRLRALGFNYFAAEALGEKDSELSRRGYPVQTSGSEYLHDPLYGDIVREAIRLGFMIVPYDSASTDSNVRDAEQAENLYRDVFARDPAARLFVHAGYAHIDKAKGRLGDVAPMAMRLAELSGVVPLTIDQTEFLETGANAASNYNLLIKNFPTDLPEVLVDRSTGQPWSAQAALYDLNVILPPALDVKTFGDEITSGFGSAGVKNVEDSTRLVTAGIVAANDMQRPAWLRLGGQRRSWVISSELCRQQLPCVVDAQYADESDEAIAADCYAFFNDFTSSTLYLHPGRYRLRAWNSAGRILSQRNIEVGGH